MTVLAVLLATRVAAQSARGPRFDPEPVRIPTYSASTPRAVSPMDLLTLRDVKGLSISPDGKYVAFVVSQAVYETNSYRSALYIVSTTPGAVPQNLGTAGMPHWDEINQWLPEAPQWSPDSHIVTYRMRTSEQETWQVWAWDLESPVPRRVTHVDGDVESYSWFPNEFRLFLTVKKLDEPNESGEASVLYDGKFRSWESVPISVAIRRATPPQHEYWTSYVRRNLERRAELPEIQKFSTTEKGQQKEQQNRTTELAGQRINDGKVSPDGKWVAFLSTNRDPAISNNLSRRLFVQRTENGARSELTPNTYYVAQYWWSVDGKTLYYSELPGDGHSPRVKAISIEDRSSRTVFASSSSDYFTEFAIDSSSTQIACLRERNTSPPEVVLIELSTGKTRTLVDLNPEFKGFILSPASRMEGINSYGDPWFAYLVRPSDYVAGKNYPLIVTTYRAGDYFLRGASGDENPIQVYAAAGFAVLCFDVGIPRNVKAGDFQTQLLDWSSPTASIEMAVQQLVHSGLVDPERVGISGFSHGEEIVGYALTHSRLFHAAVGAAGYDPSFYYIGGTVWHQLFGRWGLGGWPEGQSKKKWQEISMVLRADLVNTPILENASDSEYITYLPRVVALQELGKAIELHVYPNELHVRNQPKNKYEIYVRNLDWFRFWLCGEWDVFQNETEQTRRWRLLREASKPN